MNYSKPLLVPRGLQAIKLSSDKRNLRDVKSVWPRPSEKIDTDPVINDIYVACNYLTLLIKTSVKLFLSPHRLNCLESDLGSRLSYIFTNLLFSSLF